MKPITIYNLDVSVRERIEEEARREGLSLEQAVERLLRKALGLGPGGNGDRKADFAPFCGVWSEADEAEFTAGIEDFSAVDPRDWE